MERQKQQQLIEDMKTSMARITDLLNELQMMFPEDEKQTPRADPGRSPRRQKRR